MQNIKKYFMTLALLLTAVTGAWAQSALNVVEFEVPATWNGDNNPVTAADLPGFKAVTLAKAQTWTGAPAKGMAMLFYAFENTINLVNYNNGTGNGATAEFTKQQVFTLKSNVKFYYTAEPTTFPFPITWDATNKTTGFSLPAGNVFMNVEYYPTAEFTDGGAPTGIADIKATTDDDIVKAGTVKNIGSSTTPQGTVMYYAVQSATAPTAPDYDATGWTDKVPTATDFAEGNVYVWYYVKGADGDAESTFNDGAITKLGESGYVTLAAAPTYAITLKEDTEESDKWDISPAEATKGSTITATYSGERKVKSVKAVKKAAKSAEGHALSASAVGEIVGSDGKAYAVADKDNLPTGVTAVAMVAYKSGSNGLAIQLNGSPEKMNWADAKTYTEGLTAVSGGTWRLPSRADWQNMFVGCAVSGDATVPDANEEMNPIAGFKAKIAATGITWQSSTYWSSTESGSGAWLVGVNLDGSDARATFIGGPAILQLYVRACLAF